MPRRCISARVAVLALAFLFLYGPSAWGQGSARITGSVTHPTGVRTAAKLGSGALKEPSGAVHDQVEEKIELESTSVHSKTKIRSRSDCSHSKNSIRCSTSSRCSPFLPQKAGGTARLLRNTPLQTPGYGPDGRLSPFRVFDLPVSSRVAQW